MPAHDAGAAQASAEAPEKAQQAIDRAVRAYDAALREQPGLRPLPPEHGISQTEILRLVSALLKEAEVEVFELAMWQLWSRDEQPGGRDV